MRQRQQQQLYAHAKEHTSRKDSPNDFTASMRHSQKTNQINLLKIFAKLSTDCIARQLQSKPCVRSIQSINDLKTTVLFFTTVPQIKNKPFQSSSASARSTSIAQTEQSGRRCLLERQMSGKTVRKEETCSYRQR